MTVHEGVVSLSGEGTLTVAGWIVATAVMPVAYATGPSRISAMAGSVEAVPVATAEAEATPVARARSDEAPKHGSARVPPL